MLPIKAQDSIQEPHIHQWDQTRGTYNKKRIELTGVYITTF